MSDGINFALTEEQKMLQHWHATLRGTRSPRWPSITIGRRSSRCP